MPAPEKHKLELVMSRSPSHGFVAVCVCGWATEEMPTAGLAESALDRHVEEATMPLR